MISFILNILGLTYYIVIRAYVVTFYGRGLVSKPRRKLDARSLQVFTELLLIDDLS